MGGKTTKLEDKELVALCEAQMEVALGQYGGELSTQRANAMDYYLGEMDNHLPHEEGRSGFVSRDVLDTVEWVLPSLMKIFLDAENAVSFAPKGPEDEDQARQETEAVRHIFFEQNDGFLTLYTFFKDALLSKTGVVKTWFEDNETRREEYIGLTELEFENIIQDPSIRVEVLEMKPGEPAISPAPPQPPQPPPQAQSPGMPTPMPGGPPPSGPVMEPTVNAVFSVQDLPGKIHVEPIPPEEFGVSPECRTPDARKAPFVFHRTRKTSSELIESGYDRKRVEELPYDNDPADSEERLARYNLSDEEEDVALAHKSMRTTWVSECYIRVDGDGDGIAELLKVTLAGESPGSVLLDREEVDSIHIATATPVILTHKFHGLSLADLVMDIQDIRSTLLRGILDNTYLSNNGRMAANELVNLDDLLVSRSGGVIRTEGHTPPGQNLMPVPHPPVPQETFRLLEVLDKVIKNRTGVGDEVMGLDTDALANINTGVMVQAYEAARMRIELMARILAECGVRDIFRDVHEVARKHVDRALPMKLGGKWVQIDPREWIERTNITVEAGLGHHSRERRLMAINDLLQTQMGVIQAGGGGGTVQPPNLYATLAEKARAHGMAPEMFFTDPATLPPPPPPPPDPALIQAQAAMAKVEVDKQRLPVEQQKSSLDAQVKQMQAQSKEREAQIKAEMEQLKGQIMLRKQEVDEQSQVMNANTARMQQHDNNLLQSAKLEWEKYTDKVSAQLEKYRVDMQALTAMVQAKVRETEEIQRLQDEVRTLRQKNIGNGPGKKAVSNEGTGGTG